MGLFDYNCYIKNDNCLLKNSDGQQYTSGNIYAVNKKLTKKIPCYYSGYGYATLDYDNNDKIYDLIWINYSGEEFNTKSSYFACTNCAKSIEKECNDWIDFYEIKDSIDEIKEKIEMYEKELLFCINEQKKLLNRMNQISFLLRLIASKTE